MRLLLTFILLMMAMTSWSQTISIINAEPIKVCQGSNLNLQFTITGINPGNIFTIEISDQYGGFSNPLVSTTVSGNINTSASLSIPNIAPYSKDYQVKVSSTNPVASVQKAITIGIRTPTIVTVGSYCAGTTMILAGNYPVYPEKVADHTLQWMRNDTIVPTDTSLKDLGYGYGYFVKQNLTMADAGIYRLKAISTVNGCSAISTGTPITIKPKPDLPLVTVNPNPISSGSTSVMTVTGCSGGTVYWYDNPTTIYPYAYDFIEPYQLNSGQLFNHKTYYIDCYKNGCYSPRTSITIYVGSIPTPDPPTISANPNMAVCSGSSVSLTATGCTSGTINWSDGGTGSNRAIAPNTTTVLTATCTISGAVSGASSPLTVNVNPKPVLVITNPIAVSPPSTINLTALSVTNGSNLPSGTTLSYFTNAQATIILNTPTAVETSGTYYIKATSTAGCSDIKPVIVTISNCGSSLTLVSPTDDYNTGLQLKKSNEIITATNKIIGSANVTYRSGKSVTLNKGFKAETGTVFKAEIGGCN